jgi:2-polyprenyl-3-methyl-5-hydroxy-6-metoxy-1,4-benzoquinol methylase
VTEEQYPCLAEFSAHMGMSADKLQQAYEIECRFHEAILGEESYEKRLPMYAAVYQAVHPLYGKNLARSVSDPNPKMETVRTFSRELRGRSVLDVGCGEGLFLAALARALPHKDLVGIDVSTSEFPSDHKEIDLRIGNVIDFSVERPFEVVFSDQVVEHIAPADLPRHLASVRAALAPNGVFVLSAPNRLFGPSDVTRIVDFTNRGATPAKGTHLNETTYSEMAAILRGAGFRNLQTVCPVPKLRRVLRGCRVSAGVMEWVERTPWIIGLLRSVRHRGRCLARLNVVIVCQRGDGT